MVFGREEHRNRVSAIPVFEHNCVRLFFCPWNRQAQATHTMLRFQVMLEIEGIPPHAWDREVVECLLGSSCMVDTVAPETHSRADLSSFKVSARTANPNSIPAIRWLTVPDLVLISPLVEPTLLQCRVLIHLDEVRDLSNAGEPWFLGSSSSSGQSGIPEASDGPSGGGGASVSRQTWQFAVPNGRRSSGGGGHRDVQRGGSSVLSLWKLLPMVPHAAVLGTGPALPVRERLLTRVSAFDCLTRPATAAEEISNQRHANYSPIRPPVHPLQAVVLAADRTPTNPTPRSVEQPAGVIQDGTVAVITESVVSSMELAQVAGNEAGRNPTRAIIALVEEPVGPLHKKEPVLEAVHILSPARAPRTR
ncbi:hypothetical protein D1007_00035 [Hordeum vulgare]|nr:hypothetical protein D1007_00035 [Hordeum vulgare]